MKKCRVSVIILATALFSITGINHAGAFEFTTEIINTSGKPARVEVYARGASGLASLYTAYYMPDKSTRTVPFLGQTNTCFSFLKGTVGDQHIAPMTCTGNESSPTWSGLGSLKCCGNFRFKVVKRPDGTYHFERAQ